MQEVFQKKNCKKLFAFELIWDLNIQNAVKLQNIIKKYTKKGAAISM